jgi:plasmid stabilization system protein ParE
MNPELRFHPEAEKEVLGAAAWYFEHSSVAGKAFLLEIDYVIERIVEAPERYPSSPHKTRRAVFPRFPFSFFYRVVDDVIEIIAVAHQSRRPGYWRSR